MMVIDNSVMADLIVYPEILTSPDPDQDWWAPTHLDAEFVNVLRRYVNSGRLTGPEAHECLDTFTSLEIHRWQLDAPTRRRMLDLGQRLTAYDAAYVVVAEALDAPLITRDARLARTALDYVDCRLV